MCISIRFVLICIRTFVLCSSISSHDPRTLELFLPTGYMCETSCMKMNFRKEARFDNEWMNNETSTFIYLCNGYSIHNLRECARGHVFECMLMYVNKQGMGQSELQIFLNLYYILYKSSGLLLCICLLSLPKVLKGDNSSGRRSYTAK